MVVAIFVVGMYVGFQLPNLIFFFFEIANSSASCEGASTYYSGENFFLDVQALKADIGYGNKTNDGFRILPPMMIDDPTWDCEDTSHAIVCLGELYGIECKINLQVMYGGQDSSNHLGVDCFYDDVWKEMN